MLYNYLFSSFQFTQIFSAKGLAIIIAENSKSCFLSLALFKKVEYSLVLALRMIQHSPSNCKDSTVIFRNAQLLDP